jgi:DNA (cytosine-5)-methyltransferase 1
MKFGSVCSGIEAASVAWNQIGWEAAWFSEIEPFPSALLNHYYPDTPNLGDMTTLPDRIESGEVEAPDVFCGGTPCQAFSLAGQRKSLADARGNLSLTFCEIADAIDSVRSVRGERPCIVFWENVPGVLSTPDNAFGCFLAQLCGGDEPLIAPDGWPDAGVVSGPKRTVSWRVLDAQYFGVAQRRRRVFVVASARNDFDPAAVLLEFDGVRRDTAPSREAGEITPTLTKEGTGVSRPGHNEDGWYVAQPEIAMCLNAGAMRRQDGESETFIAEVSPFGANENATAAVMQPIPIDTMNHLGRKDSHSFGDFEPGAPSYTLTKGHSHAVAQPVVHSIDMGGNKGLNGGGILKDLTQPLGTNGAHAISAAMQVRRLTPVECERLQGFPDGYTAIPWRGKPVDECPDGPRYKALGNSWAVPVVTWIGKRIQKNLA